MLSGALIKAFAQSLKRGESSFNRIVLDNNSLRDEDFACLLTGLQELNEIKSVTYIRNDFMIKSAEAMRPLLANKGIPY